MSRQEQIEHHADRAMEELERARRAGCDEAAHAHLELSELHLARAQQLREAVRVAPPRLQLVSS